MSSRGNWEANSFPYSYGRTQSGPGSLRGRRELNQFVLTEEDQEAGFPRLFSFRAPVSLGHARSQQVTLRVARHSVARTHPALFLARAPHQAGPSADLLVAPRLPLAGSRPEVDSLDRAQIRLGVCLEAGWPRVPRSQRQFAWTARLAVARHRAASDLLQTYPYPACRALARLLPENAQSLATPHRSAVPAA